MLRKLLQTSLFLIGICFLSCTDIMASSGSYNAVEELNELTPPEQGCMGFVVAGPSNLVNITAMRDPKANDWCSEPCCGTCCTCDMCPGIQPVCITIPALMCGSVKCLHDLGIYVEKDPLDRLGFQPKRTPYMWWSLIAGGACLLASINQPSVLSDCSPTSDDPELCFNPVKTALQATGATLMGMSVLYYGFRYMLDCCRKSN